MSTAPENLHKQWPAAWFPEKPAAGSDDTPEAPGTQLRTSLETIRTILPLPDEQIRTPDRTGLSNLTEKIEAADNAKLVIPLAHTLTSRELALVFPLLAAVAKANAPDRTAARQAAGLIDRLLLIVRERACPSLYQSGWLTFQTHYPCPPITRALAILCRILEIRQQTGALLVRPESGRPELISQLVPPASRQFIPRLVRAMSESGLALEKVLKTYDIRPDLPLGTELIAQSLTTADEAVLDGAHKLFGNALQRVSPDAQLAMLHHFFAMKNLPDRTRNRYCQQIYRIFGQPDDADPIWSRLKARDRHTFQRWVREATIGSHCRQRPDKARLYLDFSHYIKTVEHWNADTLLIHFPDFVVADSRVRPDLAVCYSRTGHGHPFELAHDEFNPDPTDPAIPRRQVADAIRRADFSGTIGLPFDPEGMRLTTIFFNMRLAKFKRVSWLQTN